MTTPKPTGETLEAWLRDAADHEDDPDQRRGLRRAADALARLREERDALRTFADRYMSLADRAIGMHHHDREYRNAIVVDVCRIKSEYQSFRARTLTPEPNDG